MNARVLRTGCKQLFLKACAYGNAHTSMIELRLQIMNYEFAFEFYNYWAGLVHAFYFKLSCSCFEVTVFVFFNV